MLGNAEVAGYVRYGKISDYAVLLLFVIIVLLKGLGTR